jgi:hypothetical protein
LPGLAGKKCAIWDPKKYMREPWFAGLSVWMYVATALSVFLKARHKMPVLSFRKRWNPARTLFAAPGAA